MKNINIQVESTPNPHALKFIINQEVINEGKATFYEGDDCHGNVLARDLLALESVKQIHFFENVISITKEDSQNCQISWQKLSPQIESVLLTRLPTHNPQFNAQKMQHEKDRFQEMSPELQKIETILDQVIRSGLRADGGDIQVISYEDNKLHVRYEGACGSCPSAVTGTLYAIESILQEHFPNIEVIPTD